MTDATNTATFVAPTTVGSIGGNVTLTAGDSYTQIGSDVLAPSGDILIGANTVNILEGRETTRHQTEQRFKQSGLSLSLSNPVMDTAQGLQRQANAASDTQSTRMHALAAANSALAVKDMQQQLHSGQGTDLSLNISLGSSQSRSNSEASSNTARGSTLTTGGDLAIHALGEGDGEGNITVQGSQLDAGNRLQLNAAEGINLLASSSSASQRNSQRSSSGSVGLSLGMNSGSPGLALTLDANRAQGHGNGDSTTYTNSQLSAGNQVILNSGGDTTLKGAVVSAPQITTHIGGKLTIESLQDSATYNERHTSSGASLSVPLIGGQPTASLDASRTKLNSDTQSVNEQSGLRAGDGGFQVNVGGTTTLNGGAITSTQEAIDDDRNTFTTAGQSISEALESGALTLSDIGNRASYDAESISVGLSSGKNAADEFSAGLSGIGIGKGDGEASSTAEAAISNLAGNQDARTGDAESGLAPIFDADNVRKDVEAQTTITQEFGSRASQLVGDIAQAKVEEAQLKRLQADAAQAAGDNERANQLNAQADQLFADWGDNGTQRLAAHTAIGALTGGTQGATGAAVGTLSAPAVASALKDAGLDDTLTDGLTALASTAAGAATGGTQGGAAAFNEVVNNYLTHPEAQRLQEIDRLLERDGQALSDAQRHALEEERIAILQLDHARDDALEIACGQGGTAAACSYERALLDAAYSSWEAGDVDRDTYSDYQKTATLWADNQQQRMEHIGAEALTEMAVDAATAPLILAQLAGQAALGDEDSRAILREMGNEIKAFAANPAAHISESNREQLAQADALEQAGQRDEADRLRMRVALENQTMIMGAGGLAASLPKVASSITSRPGRTGLGDGSAATNSIDVASGEIFDPGLNITPNNTINHYPSIGANGTFVTDSRTIESIIGSVPNGATEMRITRQQANTLESDMGLNPGSLEQSNTLSIVSGVADRCPRCPIGDAGNELFLGGGEGLPGGGPELVIDSIPSGGGDGIRQITIIVED
ncbi:hemagglutinin repeat-containing protein [Vreelandella zhaodongensis]|uniref:hemagglutinin repeat-containing protein n=1 Tax=Vreelandella zhaodongensis TaxID=1176240 RepID=UPI003EBDC9B4